MRKIPINGAIDSAIERLPPVPSQLCLDDTRIDRITKVVPEPVGH
jgi:hypothetical protein